jgi:hypothetical protein
MGDLDLMPDRESEPLRAWAVSTTILEWLKGIDGKLDVGLREIREAMVLKANVVDVTQLANRVDELEDREEAVEQKLKEQEILRVERERQLKEATEERSQAAKTRREAAERRSVVRFRILAAACSLLAAGIGHLTFHFP